MEDLENLYVLKNPSLDVFFMAFILVAEIWNVRTQTAYYGRGEQMWILSIIATLDSRE